MNKITCPYCDKTFDKEILKDVNLIKIKDLLRNKEMSIAELHRITQIHRSTLCYYLIILEAQKLITKERMEKGYTGRPTIIKWRRKPNEIQS